MTDLIIPPLPDYVRLTINVFKHNLICDVRNGTLTDTAIIFDRDQYTMFMRHVDRISDANNIAEIFTMMDTAMVYNSIFRTFIGGKFPTGNHMNRIYPYITSIITFDFVKDHIDRMWKKEEDMGHDPEDMGHDPEDAMASGCIVDQIMRDKFFILRDMMLIRANSQMPNNNMIPEVVPYIVGMRYLQKLIESPAGYDGSAEDYTYVLNAITNMYTKFLANQDMSDAENVVYCARLFSHIRRDESINDPNYESLQMIYMMSGYGKNQTIYYPFVVQS